jgi:hypothetical protein
MKMITKKQLRVFFILCTLFLMTPSCNKHKKPAINSAPPLLAPCGMPDNSLYSAWFTDTVHYNKYKITYAPDVPYENCHYHVKLKSEDSSVVTHLYFKEEPQTGIYIPGDYQTLESDASFGIKHIKGSFEYFCRQSDDPVYVNNKNGIITISFCNLALRIDFTDQFWENSIAKIVLVK